MKTILFSSIIACVVLASSCAKEETKNTDASAALAGLNLPETPYNYANIALPAHYTTNAFPPQANGQHEATFYDNTPSNNPITDEGATLGRVYFTTKN